LAIANCTCEIAVFKDINKKTELKNKISEKIKKIKNIKLDKTTNIQIKVETKSIQKEKLIEIDSDKNEEEENKNNEDIKFKNQNTKNKTNDYDYSQNFVKNFQLENNNLSKIIINKEDFKTFVK